MIIAVVRFAFRVLALPAGCPSKHEEALLKGEHQALRRLDSGLHLPAELPPAVTASPQPCCKHSRSWKVFLTAALEALLPHLDDPERS